MGTILLIKDFLSKKFTISTWQILLGGVIFVILFFSLKGCGKGNTSQLPTPSLKPAVIYKDKNNNTHSTITVTTGNVENYQAQFDSLKKLIKDKDIKIKEMSKYTVQVDTYFRELPIYIDTTKKELSFEKRDNYIDITAAVDMSIGRADIGLISSDTLTYTKYQKKKFLGTGTEKIDISNKNPYNHIQEGYSIDITTRTPVIVFGPSIGASYGINTGKIAPYIGVGATLNLFSIKSKK